MQNIKIFMGVFNFIQNDKFFVGWVRAFWLFGFFFFCLLRPKSKMENGYLFAKKFCMMFSSILQNDRPKPKFF
jgi:hypothetical protein